VKKRRGDVWGGGGIDTNLFYITSLEEGKRGKKERGGDPTNSYNLLYTLGRGGGRGKVKEKKGRKGKRGSCLQHFMPNFFPKREEEGKKRKKDQLLARILGNRRREEGREERALILNFL